MTGAMEIVRAGGVGAAAGAEELRSAAERALAGKLSDPGALEVDDAGIYVHRDKIPSGDKTGSGRGDGPTGREPNPGDDEKERCYRALEALLAPGRGARVFDFAIAQQDLAGSLHDGRALRLSYAGAALPGGGRSFRVDHHYQGVAALACESTTPLVRRWVLALHALGRADLLAALAGARYLADHCDVDILFAQHLAAMAQDRGYVEEVGAVLAAAALHNDYPEPIPPRDEPWGSRAYYAGLEVEDRIRSGRLSFADALARVLPGLGAWIASGEAPPRRAEHAELARFVEAGRADEEEKLARIAAWDREGRLRAEGGGALWLLDAPAEVDNSVLYLYLAARPGIRAARVQLLSFPKAGGVQHKLRRTPEGPDLDPWYPVLRQEFPDASFGGRSAAGGSHVCAAPHAEVARVLRGLVAAEA